MLTKALGWCHSRWGGRWKSQDRNIVPLSPYVEKPLNSKVIKSFVPEQRSRKYFSCFEIPMFYLYGHSMYILHIAISWLWYSNCGIIFFFHIKLCPIVSILSNYDFYHSACKYWSTLILLSTNAFLNFSSRVCVCVWVSEWDPFSHTQDLAEQYIENAQTEYSLYWMTWCEQQRLIPILIFSEEEKCVKNN